MAKQKITRTVKKRVKKIPDGNVKCNVCHGTGYHKKPKRT